MNVRSVFSLGLAAVLQLLPLTRAVVAVAPVPGSSYAIVATWIAGAAALLGGVDAVSGASTVITSPTSATATNGVAFSYRITTGPQTANTFAAAPLPTGLSVSTSSGRITGTPVVTGVFVIQLTASDSGMASRTVKTNLTLTILAGSGGGAVAPSITTQPTSQTVVLGGNASFTVAASGTAPLTYRWRLAGANLADGTNATLSLLGVNAAQAGSYTCLVSNSAGSVTSSVATLTVLLPPTITVSPSSQTVPEGSNVSFSVVANGTAPLRYQWQLNGANVAGATNATLALAGVTTNQSGDSYVCVVSNLAGTATSSAAILTVNRVLQPPTITQHPVNQSVTAGATVMFTVAANGAAPLSYQWRLNGAAIAEATNATLVLPSVTVGQSGGSYSCLVTNSVGAATSGAGLLTVTATAVAPTITVQPTNQTVTAGATVSFNVGATGTAPMSYQWRLNGGNLSGATNPTLTLVSVTTNLAGHGYACVVSNSAGMATSQVAVLTVNPPPLPPVITKQPDSVTVAEGGGVSFAVTATGATPMSFQWYANNSVWAGATNATCVLGPVAGEQTDSIYWCVVSNVYGATTSQVAHLVVTPRPADRATFLIEVVGDGRVTPNLSASPLVAGRVYTLTAVPAADSRFVGWELAGHPLSASPMISLVAAGNQSLRARFEKDPVVAVAGSYEGLFLPTEGVNPELTGALKILVAKTGKISGAIRQGMRRYAMRGQLDANLQAEVQVTGTPTQDLRFTLTFALVAGEGQLQGEVSVGSQPGQVWAFRRGAGTNFAGTYTLALVDGAGDESLPRGWAAAALRVSARGEGVLSGVLADGSRFTQSAPVSAAGWWPLYAPAAGGRHLVYGWVPVADFLTNTASAQLTLLRFPAAASTASGYTNQLTALGSPYSQVLRPALALERPALYGSGGVFAQPFWAGLIWDAGGSLRAADANNLTLSTVRSTGLLSGKIRDAHALQFVPFRGVLLQNRALGVGFVSNGFEQGQLLITEQP